MADIVWLHTASVLNAERSFFGWMDTGTCSSVSLSWTASACSSGCAIPVAVKLSGGFLLARFCPVSSLDRLGARWVSQDGLLRAL